MSFITSFFWRICTLHSIRRRDRIEIEEGIHDSEFGSSGVEMSCVEYQREELIWVWDQLCRVAGRDEVKSQGDDGYC
jgi:hypothetical protein